MKPLVDGAGQVWRWNTLMSVATPGRFIVRHDELSFYETAVAFRDYMVGGVYWWGFLNPDPKHLGLDVVIQPRDDADVPMAYHLTLRTTHRLAMWLLATEKRLAGM